MKLFRTVGSSTALQYAVAELEEKGWHQSPSAKIILLPVPSFEESGLVKGGGDPNNLPADALIVGGKLSSLTSHNTLDLLSHPLYLSENAAITAHCALQVATQHLPVVLKDCNILVIGWGRIGKCLVRLLRLLGANVTVAAHSESDSALLEALGYRVIDLNTEDPDLRNFRVIFNTADFPVLPSPKQSTCRADCVKIDLASSEGIEGQDVIRAKGLPNKYAPESSGKLIARIVEKELSL